MSEGEQKPALRVSQSPQIIKFTNISSYFLFLVDKNVRGDADIGLESKSRPLKF